MSRSKWVEEFVVANKDVGRIKELTKQLKAKRDLSKGLMQRNEKNKRDMIKKDIHNMLSGY